MGSGPIASPAATPAGAGSRAPAEPSPRPDAPASTETEGLPATPLIQLRGLTRGFREGDRQHMVLRQADAVIGRSGSGEIAVIVGRSGSGKSTLLNLLAGIDLPDAGTVVIGGVELSRLDERARTLFRRDRIGFIFQFFNLLPTLTVEENLLLPLDLQGRLTPASRREALGLLAEVGLAGRAESFPDRLSGGEQQRVAVARALVHGPLLVLADEPTGNLDLDTSLQILELLDRLTRRAGKTLVMATHSAEGVGIADRVFRIEDGRLIEGDARGEAAGRSRMSGGEGAGGAEGPPR